MTVLLRSASAADTSLLSDLAVRSKGYWGYSDEFLDACRCELTITDARLTHEDITVAEVDGRVAGFSSLVVDAPASELRDLFVDPTYIGQGAGLTLWNAVCDRARKGGAQWMTIDADPHAASWYERRGAWQTGTRPSGSIAGRQLPTLRVEFSRRLLDRSTS